VTFFVVLAIIIGVPFLNILKTVIMLQMAQSEMQEEASKPGTKPPPAPPLLNESNLTGTAWIVRHPQIPCPVTIRLNPGGQAVASVPPEFAPLARQFIGTDTLVGTWRVDGAKLIASVDFQGKTHTVECEIIGDKIYYGDKEIQRAS
jgi:hypothetical protein